MMRRPGLLLLLLLASCSDTGREIAAAPPSPQEAACATEADQDPALKEARAISAGQPNWEFQHEPEVRQIKRDAITRCLKARGLMSRGGVERAR